MGLHVGVFVVDVTAAGQQVVQIAMRTMDPGVGVSVVDVIAAGRQVGQIAL